jgi:SAM-dependent methyltransferase
VWGVDTSVPMLERLEAKPGGSRVRTVRTDMSTIDLPDEAPSFGVVFAAFNTFFMMTTREEQLACLRRTGAVLAPDGVAVLDLFVPRDPISPRGGIEVTSIGVERLVLRAYRRWPTANTFEGHHVELTDDGVRLRPWRMRIMMPTELDALADEAGLRLADRWSDWDDEPFTDGSRRHISVYARA